AGHGRMDSGAAGLDAALRGAAHGDREVRPAPGGPVGPHRHGPARGGGRAGGGLLLLRTRGVSDVRGVSAPPCHHGPVPPRHGPSPPVAPGTSNDRTKPSTATPSIEHRSATMSTPGMPTTDETALPHPARTAARQPAPETG